MRTLIYKNSTPYTIFWSAILLGLVSFLSISTSAHAQNTYPNKPLKLIAPFPPGGTSDILGRILAQKLSDSLGQSMIVENKGGASGNIGHEYQEELSTTENKVSFARQFYNDNVRSLNQAVATIPTSFFAGLAKVSARAFYEVENPADRNVPNVKF